MSADPGSDSQPPLLPDSKTIQVLYIGNDRDFADLVAAFLERERESFDVHTKTDPRDALTTVRDEPTEFDCIVSDYDMPGLDGLDVLERVRNEHPDLPFILFAGQGSEEIASEAITAGVTEYLQKDGGTEQYRVLANRVQNSVERYWVERFMDRGLEAIETAQDGISILGRDGHVQYANTAYADILGYERDELLGLHWETFYRDDDVDDVYDVLLREAQDGRWHGETSFVRKDGDVIDVEHTLAYTNDDSLICTLSRPACGDPNRRTSSAKERAMDEAPIGIVLTDPCAEDNPIVYANDKFTEITGYDRAETIGRNCRFLQGEQTAENTVAEIRTAIENREPVTVELRNYRADGTEFWNRVRIAPVFDEDNDLDLFVGFQDDVTTRKTYEQRLRSSTARLEALFDNSPDLIAVHDAEGVVRDVNRRMCDELGYTEEELVGQMVWDLDPTVDPSRARSFWEDLPTNTPYRFEGELERRGGATFPIEIHLIRLNLDGKDRFVAMDRDISEQKAREAELLEQNERLNRFTSVVSHDLRNPLQIAMGRLELLQEECDSEHIEDIEVALTRMDALIEDLLALAQDGEDAMEIESVALADLVRACWDTVATKDATLDVNVDGTVKADRDQLRQLFENLFGNAVEHGGEDVTVTVGPTDTGFYVADDGAGIPESDRDDVFEPGYSTSPRGTGFGLNIVSQVADVHDWDLAVLTGRDGGARFEISGVRG